jgi:hypothetical protein
MIVSPVLIDGMIGFLNSASHGGFCPIASLFVLF